MHKIGIISDTHGLLRPQVREALVGCEQIFHGGDINKQEILDELEQIAPVFVVRGNNDKEWASHIPETLSVTVQGLGIFMVHNKKFIPQDLPDTDLVIYGHSHKYEERKAEGVYYLNPGSCGPRRFHQEITMALLYVEEDGSFRVEKIVIPHEEKKKPGAGKRTAREACAEETAVPPDLALQLPSIMQEIDAGKTVKQIARKHQISEELSSQINRMYLTHPGVDVDGILRRLGL